MTDRFQKRRDRLRRTVRKQDFEALLVTDEVNVKYLTGFTGDSSFLLLGPKDDQILSDSRYTQQIEEECPGLDMAIRGPATTTIDLAAKTLGAAKLRDLGIETHSMTVAFRDRLDDALPSTSLAPSGGLVEELRMIKDREEIETLRCSIRIAARGFEVLRSTLSPEKTELQIRDELEFVMRGFGAQDRGFDSIVAVGPRAALPHAIPTSQRVEESGLLLVDWGAQYSHYISDLTRVLVTGKLTPKLARIYNVVLAAQMKAIETIRPGATGEDVDAAARGVITDAGFGKRFQHGTGHGIGLQVHESPRMAEGCAVELRPGMVVTVEPGIYIPGWGGVRIEDDILVTRDGHEVLSRDVPKQLEEMIAPTT